MRLRRVHFPLRFPQSEREAGKQGSLAPGPGEPVRSFACLPEARLRCVTPSKSTFSCVASNVVERQLISTCRLSALLTQSFAVLAVTCRVTTD